MKHLQQLALFLFVTTACQTSNYSGSLDSLPEQVDCDSLLTQAEKFRKESNISSTASEIAGSAASVTLSAMGYVGDTLVVFGGLGVGIIVCSPVIAIESAANSVGSASSECVGSVTGGVLKSRQTYGSNIYDTTQSWRDHKHTKAAASFRHVAQCYERQGSLDNLHKAIELLSLVRESQDFEGHVLAEEWRLHDLLRERIEEKIASLEFQHKTVDLDSFVSKESSEKKNIISNSELEKNLQKQSLGSNEKNRKERSLYWPKLAEVKTDKDALGNRWILYSKDTKSIWMLRSNPTTNGVSASRYCSTYQDSWGSSWRLPKKWELLDALRNGLSSKKFNQAFGDAFDRPKPFVWTEYKANPVAELVVGGTVKPLDFFGPNEGKVSAMPLCILN